MTITHTVADFAADFDRRGWVPIPVPYKSKNPNRPGWQHETYNPSAFIRGPVNIGVRLGDPSGGLVDVDLDCPMAIRVADAFLDPTQVEFGRRTSPRSHRLYIADPIPKTDKRFKDPTEHEDDDRATLVELRSTGAQTIMPGSMHHSGESVEWSSDGEPAQIHGQLLRTQVAHVAAAALLARHWRPGKRHDLSLALAGGLTNAGWPAERVEGFIQAVAYAAGDEEVDERLVNVRTTIERASSKEKYTGWPTVAELTDTRIVDKVRDWLELEIPVAFRTRIEQPKSDAAPVIDPATGETISRPCTDLGNAERFRDAHRGKARYVHDENSWYIYGRTHWRKDVNGAARRLFMMTARNILGEASRVEDEKKRKATVNWAYKSESAKAIRDALSLAGDLSGIATERLDFDRKRLLLNCDNGTYDLQAGELRDHDPANLLTRITPVAYDPHAHSDLWDTFLGDVTGEADPWGDMRMFLQRSAGSCLAGWSGDECLYFLFGPTQTGKSTFLESIRAALGGYVAPLNFDSLLKASTGEPRPDLVAVVGARILVSNEMDRSRRAGDTQLASSLIKRFTSGEPIRVRNNYSNGFDWTPDAVLWLAANDAPQVDHDDEAMWRRIHRIPFNRQHNNPDKTIRRRLTTEPEHQSAVLAWLIEGWHQYRKHSIEIPDAVRKSTEEYRHEQNPLGEFVQSSCTLDPEGRIPVAEFNQAYERYCEEMRISPVDGRERKAALEAFGCYQRQAKFGGTNKRAWFGVRMRELWGGR